MKQKSVLTSVFALFFFCFSLFSQAVYAQDFSSIDNDLQELENLLNDTIANTEEQQRLLEDLKTNLDESEELIDSYENIIQEQEALLRDLQTRLNEMSEIYRTQSDLSARYARNSRFWRIFTIIAIPLTAAVSGFIGWSAGR
jgi:septal ring factor EnvC (AmiA/AmiB activator)